MLKVKYSDEKYLCKYDLDMSLFDNLGVDILDLWPTRNIFMLDTKQGKKILKIIDYSEERLNFICKSIEYLKKSYDNILVINSLPNNKKFLEWQGQKYILLDVIDGIEYGIANPLELEIATKSIAKMHNASKGIINIFKSDEIKDNCCMLNLKERFEKSREKLTVFKDQVNKYEYKNEFDSLFIKDVDYYIDSISNCIELLEKSSYNKMCNDKKYWALCHNDLAYHNILIKDGVANFIDFDYCSIDLRMKDVWNFLIKSIKKFGFSIEMCDNIIAYYNEEYKITKEEFEVLYMYLMFPNDFFIISEEYYLKLKDWSYESYLNKFENKIDYKPEKNIFLNHFYKKYVL